MQQLISLSSVEGRQSVCARELYLFLGFAENQWSRWYKKNILENIFAIKGLDYQELNIMSSTGNPTRDFALSLDFAERLSMLARTEKGEQIRNFFIECKKKLVEIATTPKLPKDYKEALQLSIKKQKQLTKALEQLYEKETVIEQKTLQLEQQKHKVDFFDLVIDSKSAVDMRKVAAVIGIKDLGRNNLFEFLRNSKILSRGNIPYRQYIDSGYFRVIEQEYKNSKGEVKMRCKTVVFQKGVDYIIKRLREAGYVNA